MPDWFYRTLGRPVLFALPGEAGRRLALGTLGTLGRMPAGVGGSIIDFLGHMRPAPELAREVAGVRLAGPVGLGSLMDPEGAALEAWAHFGAGFLEVGPLACGTPAPRLVERVDDRNALRETGDGAVGLTAPLRERLRRLAARGVPLLVRERVRRDPGGWRADLGEGFPDFAAGRVFDLSGLDTRELDALLSEPATLAGLGAAAPRPPWRLAGLLTAEVTTPRLHALRRAGLNGVLIVGAQRVADGLLHGPDALPDAVAAAAKLRDAVGREFVMVVNGVAGEPADARALLAAGADAVALDTALVFAGPGVCKRVNEGLLAERPPPPPPPARASGEPWFWALMLGAGMLVGSVLALWIAATRVVLPYDEQFCGWTRTEIRGFNPRLLDFMTHDRVSLAGTMLAIGILYAGLALGGLRRGVPWARTAVLVSGGIGFASFFLFLGFGYFDPFHGFVTAILFQLYALVWFAAPGPPVWRPPAEWRESPAWRRARWGELLLLLHAAGLLAAGGIIAWIGIGEVFVATDLAYLQTSLEALRAGNPRLVPLVAHDRATMGGMLLASGAVYLLAALRGVRRDSEWLWHLLLWSGVAAYAAAVGVHLAVGYTDWRHLAPAAAGCALLLGGMALCRREMTRAPATGPVVSP